jgi:hypothetical protein
VAAIQKPKKFWIWGTPIPNKYAVAYSEAELAEFKLQFSEIARRKQKFNRFVTPLTFIFFFIIIAFVLAGHIWLLLLFPIFIGLMFVFSPELYCPACHIVEVSGAGSFCPECNGEMKTREGFWRGGEIYCSKCGKSPRTNKGGSRNYKLHYCSHCGVKLSDAGV